MAGARRSDNYRRLAAMKVMDAAATAATIQALALDAPQGVGFAVIDRARDTFYGWHAHPYHQLLYAVAGLSQIETATARFLLPAMRAIWIPAGTQHRTLVGAVEGASLFFDPAAMPAGIGTGEVRVLGADPLMREMILHARRWPRGAALTDALAQSYFTTLALLCAEWLAHEVPLRLPRADDPAIARAMDYALAAPGAATLGGALDAACLSERTFRRRFPVASGMGWAAWLAQARIMAAMAQLADGARVTEVAAEAGFASLSAFADAFRRIAGEAPSAYRRRLRGG